MDIQEISKLLGKVAPWLAAASTGPVGIATMAIKTVAEAVGATDESADSVAAALAGAKPEQLAELRRADMEFKVRMQELGINSVRDLAKIEADDRDSARKANVASGMNWSLFWLSVLLLTISLGCEVALLFKGYPSGIPDLVVGRVLGMFDSIALTVLAYWFGTSAGSARKTDLMAAAK